MNMKTFLQNILHMSLYLKIKKIKKKCILFIASSFLLKFSLPYYYLITEMLIPVFRRNKKEKKTTT